MEYWIILLSVVFMLSWLYTYTAQTEQSKKIIVILIIAILVYFSGFRDGLGKDYHIYIHQILFAYTKDFTFVLSEPFFELLALIIRNSILSHIFYFLTMSILILVPTIYYYKKFDNFFIIVVIYMLLPTLFGTTFNVIRQSGAAAIFLFSIRYIEARNIKKYFLSIFIAILMHKSAVILFPLYFINFKKINILYIIIVLILSLIPSIANNLLKNFSSVIQVYDYERYLGYTTTVVGGVSMVNVMLHLFLIPIFFYKNKILSMKRADKYIIAIKMYVLYLVFSNVALATLPIAYRISFYFALFIPIVLSMMIKFFNNPKDRIVVTLFLLTIFFSLGTVFFYSHIDDPSIVPSKILPINSIIDN